MLSEIIGQVRLALGGIVLMNFADEGRRGVNTTVRQNRPTLRKLLWANSRDRDADRAFSACWHIYFVHKF
jgi:hypothetical protein